MSKKEIIYQSEIVRGDIVISPMRLKNGRIGALTNGCNGQLQEAKSVFEFDGDKWALSVPQFPQQILSLATNNGVVRSKEELFNEILKLIKEVLVLPYEDIVVLSQYILCSYIYDEYSYICYISLTGRPGSGKSTALTAIHKLGYNSIAMSGMSSLSAQFRVCDKVRGLVCLDEAQQSATNHSSDYHKFLADGNSKGGNVMKSTQKGKSSDFVPESYSIFCPKVLSGRSTPGDDAILSRCISIAMQPASREEASKLVDPYSTEWSEKAQKLKNDLILFRQRRKLNESV